MHHFDRHQLTDEYYSEGIAVGDINGDGQVDIVHGPYWFEGPDLRTKHEIFPAVPQDREGYTDHFFAWVYDFDRNGENDVLVVGLPGEPAYVYENPGPQRRDQHWPKHQVFDWVSNEAPHFVDLVGDDVPELVCTRDGFFGFAKVDPQHPFDRWAFYPISDQVADKKYGHGLGVGDVNGDGRLDILHAQGWFERPAHNVKRTRWTSHTVPFSDSYGGAEMHVYDVDGDGDADVISSLTAHDFGLAWFEQIQEGDAIQFKRHLIMGEHPSQNRYGVLFTEMHSVGLADLDGDGLKDIVTGKTYFSHHRQSPMWNTGPVVYWFRLTHGANGVDWVPYQIDDHAGIGRQICIQDVNADGLLDVLVGGMQGAHALFQRREKVDAKTWDQAQPKPIERSRTPDINQAEAPRGPAAPIDAGTATVPGALEAESLPTRADSGEVTPQEMAAFEGDLWSDNRQLWWVHGKPGSELTIELPGKDGPGTLELVLTRARDYAIVQLALNDQPLGKPIDLYHSKVETTGVLEFTDVPLRPDRNELRVQIVGANPAAVPSYLFGMDYLRIRGQGESFPVPKSVATRPVPLTDDEYPHAGLSAEQAAKAMQVPEGFQILVGASEPDVKQPIAMALDDRGRVWVAEAYEYPVRAEGDHGRDRILIFEDSDGDGTLDQRKVFAEGLNLVSGLELGFGGVWVGAAPYLLFIADRNGDDIPDGEPTILLDGWGLEDTHETLNTFVWGPDGWLYGCHGVFTHSRVGRPGTPDDQRIPLNAAIWRYHPTRHVFERFAEGTSNPWGIDFDDHGQAFATACVIPHLFHVIQGARYQRQAGAHFNPHTYIDIPTIADHLHYLGQTPHSGNSKSDAAGGGHAHCGALIYMGGVWPPEYRNSILMNNVHGQRVNRDRLTPQGSGFVGGHEADFLLTGDQASQILNFRYGPDGQVWMIDWYDMQACHLNDPGKHDRSNGRIYKIVYGDVSPAQVDLRQLSDLQLAEQMLHQNDWYVRHGRRLLQERAAARPIDEKAVELLKTTARTEQDDTRALRALWALHVIGQLPSPMAESFLDHTSPYLRGWAIQFLLEKDPGGEIPTELLSRFIQIARHDPSPVVRLYLASGLQRIPDMQRWDVLAALAAHAEDASDHNLPIMLWYALEPLAESAPQRALALAVQASESMPLLRDLMLRRIGSLNDETAALTMLVDALGAADGPEAQLTYLAAIRAGLVGQRRFLAPTHWNTVFDSLADAPDLEVRVAALALGTTFDSPGAGDALKSIVRDHQLSPAVRQSALRALLTAQAPDLALMLQSLIDDQQLREIAIEGLAQYDDPTTATLLLDRYSQLNTKEKRLALGTLCSRAPFAISLLAAVERSAIPASDLTADLARQLQYLRDTTVDEQLAKIWGTVRETDAERLAVVDHYKSLSATASDDLDACLGRTIFAKTCQRCHMLYGIGESVGPDLTGSNRADLDYLLSNIVDPSAVVTKEYQQTIIISEDGRVLSGVVKSEDARAVVLQTPDATVVIPKGEIAERILSDKSMMPDDQLKEFSDQEVQALLTYLRGPRQVPLLATRDNASSLFNGRDLTGWHGNPQLWSVENGEIVGRSAGLDQNEFLVSDLTAKDFRLSLDVKLVKDNGNSGIQFRSRSHDGQVEGYQADIGPGWWGKLYEEDGRGLLWDRPADQHVKTGEWNHYVILAEGSRIRTYLNGQPCVELDDPDGSRHGIFALQLHSGDAMEVRFRNLQLEILEQ